MKQLLGHMPLVSYANSTEHTRTVPRGTVNDQEPPTPPGLTAAQAYRWRIGRRHLTAAEHTDINALDPAGRARHFDRLRATVDDLLRLAEELAHRPPRQPGRDSDAF